MKRVGNLMDSIIELDNLALAALKAFRGKRCKREVIEFSECFTDNLQNLRDEIAGGTFDVGNYYNFYVYDPKKRLISAVRLRERIFQHAIMNVLHDYFDRMLIFDTYATRPNKGVYKALERLGNKMAGYSYYAKLDVRKYFDNIGHDILKRMLNSMFKDTELLCYLYKIIDSYCVGPNKGVPIGNLTSQYFANLYLSGLDHYMKEQVKASVYIRYMDDVVILGHTKEQVKHYAKAYIEYANAHLELEIKPIVYGMCTGGINFLGYKVFHGYMLMNSRSKKRYRKKIVKCSNQYKRGEIGDIEYGTKLQTLTAFSEHAKSKRFRASCISLIEG